MGLTVKQYQTIVLHKLKLTISLGIIQSTIMGNCHSDLFFTYLSRKGTVLLNASAVVRAL
jgi:hypothetical protein